MVNRPEGLMRKVKEEEALCTMFCDDGIGDIQTIRMSIEQSYRHSKHSFVS
jgi:hypothetical protein